MPLRIVFMGTPAFAVPVLERILVDGHSVVAVYSQPPRPAGRGMENVTSPVHQFAAARDISVLTPLNFKVAADQEIFSAHDADAAVVVAYGLLLPQSVLDAPRLGCFNVHASKLPRWRGAAPIQRAIMAGDASTAVAIMRMERGLDTGPVCLTTEVPITPEMTAGELHNILSVEGAALMSASLKRLETGTLMPVPQAQDGVTYAAKIDKAETKIDFGRPAAEVVNHIRGLSPFPGAWFELPGAKPERIKVLAAHAIEGNGEPGTALDEKLTVACRSGAVRFDVLQRSGKKALPASEFLRGSKIATGLKLT